MRREDTLSCEREQAIMDEEREQSNEKREQAISYNGWVDRTFYYIKWMKKLL